MLDFAIDSFPTVIAEDQVYVVFYFPLSWDIMIVLQWTCGILVPNL